MQQIFSSRGILRQTIKKKVYLFHHPLVLELASVDGALHVEVGQHAGRHVAEAPLAQTSGKTGEGVHTAHTLHVAQQRVRIHTSHHTAVQPTVLKS